MFDEREDQIVNQEVQEEISPEPENKSEETGQQKNFRELRTKLERAQRERDEAINYIKNIEAKNNSANIDVNIPDEDFELDPDAIAEGKHISKVNKKVKALEQQLKNYQQHSAETITEARLKAKYQDFDKVVSEANIAALRDSHPELWSSINTTPDLYNKAVSAYTLIKELKLSPDDSYEQDKLLIQKNAAKPKPFSAVSSQQGDSPLTKANAFANGLTDELKDQLRKEMELARRNR